jgi:hypothetical protein
MTEKEIKCLSPFARAKVSEAVMAEVGIDDVQTIDSSRSTESAKAFLVKHASAIGEAMVIAGVKKISDQLVAENIGREENRGN